MKTMLDDLIASVQSVPESITGIISSDWNSKHIFYGDAGGMLGVGGQNRGRCPFVRVFRGPRDFNAQTSSSRGGTVTSNFIIEIVVTNQRMQDQEDQWDQAYQIFESIRDDLRGRANYRIGGETVEQLQFNPTIFVLKINFNVENSY